MVNERAEGLESPDAVVARADRRRADTASGRDYLRSLCAKQAGPLEEIQDMHLRVDRLLDDERFLTEGYGGTLRALIDAGDALRRALDRWPA